VIGDVEVLRLSLQQYVTHLERAIGRERIRLAAQVGNDLPAHSQPMLVVLDAGQMPSGAKGAVKKGMHESPRLHAIMTDERGGSGIPFA
jgi:hypothetical protein